MSEKLTYTEAYEELRKIVSDLEDGEIQVDELSDKVKRASELIRFCKAKLKSTEFDVDQILKDLENEENK